MIIGQEVKNVKSKLAYYTVVNVGQTSVSRRSRLAGADQQQPELDRHSTADPYLQKRFEIRDAPAGANPQAAVQFLQQIRPRKELRRALATIGIRAREDQYLAPRTQIRHQRNHRVIVSERRLRPEIGRLLAGKRVKVHDPSRPEPRLVARRFKCEVLQRSHLAQPRVSLR